jgi:uncharacterized protein (TIRG00374 family)
LEKTNFLQGERDSQKPPASTREREQRRRLALIFLKSLLSFLILGSLIRAANPHSIGSVLVKLDLRLYFLALVTYLAFQLVRSIRWRVLLTKDQIAPSLSHVACLYFIGMFFNAFLPTIVGGDTMRYYYASRWSGKKSAVAASIIFERFSGISVLILVFFAASLLSLKVLGPSPLLLFLIAVSACLVGAMGASLSLTVFNVLSRPLGLLDFWKVKERLSTVRSHCLSYMKDRLLVGKVLFLSLLFQLSIIVVYYVLSAGLEWEVPLISFFLFVPVITFSAMLPVSLNGLGVREGVCVFLFAQLGVPTASALSLGLLWLSINLVTASIGAALYPFFKGGISGKR